MQNILLDILIIGLLVLLFGSIYRKHATVRIRFWLLGWIFVLVHFGLLLLNPSRGSGLTVTAAMSALMVCGAAFVLSFSLVWESYWWFGAPAVLLTIPPVTYIVAATTWDAPVLILVAIAGVVQAGFAIIGWRLGRGQQAEGTRARTAVARWWSVAIVGASAGWMFWMIPQDPGLSFYPMLTEVFLLCAVLYWEEYRQRSAGVLTGVLGLAAWGLVFPFGLAAATLWPQFQIDGEWWNVPKYFVAFGMILTLLEEQKLEADTRSEEYRVLFENNPHPMWIFDTETLHFLKVNDAAVARYGYSQEEFRGMNLREIRPPNEVDALEQTIAGSREDESVLISGPWTHILRDGRRIQVEVSSHSIRFEGRKARFSLVQDVTERQQMHHQLLHQAHHDMLTGLPNRLLLMDRMEQALASAARRSKKAAIICLDLDRFKQINDTYGHAVGDLCLKHVAERLKSRLRASDTVARSGGEEFTIVAGDLNAVHDAEKIAEDLLAALRKPLVVDEYPIDMTASFGIALYPDHGEDAAELWRNADAAMYRVKRSGGNQYVLVSREISESTAEANELEMYMRRAVKEGGFEMYYQPEYGCTGELRGLEALLRLRHPKLGAVSPERFIPIAEESGLIVPVGDWVLREVCRQAKEWREQGFEVPRIAVNVSPLQLMRMDFSGQVRAVVQEMEMPPEVLEIEMTETTVMRNEEDVARQMRELAELGIRFSVDDFGTGYSSLQHLNQLPIQTLKIDRTFIDRLCDSADTRSLVQAILSLAHSLGLQVVAEGVETVEQMEVLIGMECDVMQGFLFSQPQPASRIPGLVRDERIAALWGREGTIPRA